MQNQELLRLPNAETLARVREKERENRFGWLRYPILRGQIPPPRCWILFVDIPKSIQR